MAAILCQQDLAAAGSLKGEWDASSGVFPGGGVTAKGDTWLVTEAGTTGGRFFAEGDRIVALVVNASTSVFGANWGVIPANARTVVAGVDEGAGTANAIQVTTEDAVADGMVVMFSLFEATTASPVTVSINGGAALTLKNVAGENASALVGGQEIWGRYRASDNTLRLLLNDSITSAERSKLAGIQAGAQVNTITSVAGKTGAVTLGKGDVGLGNVDNTADVDKPVSTAVQAALDDKTDSLPVGETDAGGMVPLIAAEDGIAAWLDHEGAFAVDKIGKHVKLPNATQVVPTGAAITLIVTSDGEVILWLEADGLHGRGLTQGISVSDATAMFSPRLSSGLVPASTDGRTLTRARRKAAQVRAGASDPLRIAMLGDSWCQGNPIPTAMTEYMASIFGDCGKSWVHAAPTGHWSGVTVTASAGWTFLDADLTSGWPYGTSPDGQVGWTDQATDTLAIVTPSCTEARIYTRSHGGTWRYRVDGGAWTVVTEPTGGALTVTTITGLAASTHTIDIDTTGNAGIVSWCGLDTRTAGASAEVIKLGNGGLTGHDMRTYINNTGDIWADLDPDLVVVILGTNDYIYADSTVQEFSAALAEIVSTVSAAVDDVGFVFVAPALSPTTAIVPLSEYRDAMYSQALSTGTDYLNGYDMIAPYADDPSIWTDSRHLNQTGGDVMVRLINTKLTGI